MVNRKYFRFILYPLLDICRQFYHASTCTHPQRVQDPTSDYSAYLDYQMQVVLTHDQVIKWARMISKLKFPWAVLDLACGWPLLKIAVIPPRRSTASRIASFPNRNSATRKTISERWKRGKTWNLSHCVNRYHTEVFFLRCWLAAICRSRNVAEQGYLRQGMRTLKYAGSFFIALEVFYWVAHGFQSPVAGLIGESDKGPDNKTQFRQFTSHTPDQPHDCRLYITVHTKSNQS